MNIGTDLLKKGICSVCGSEFQRKTFVGRSREYCSDTCKDFNKFKNALERTILKIDFKGKYSNQAKSDLFAISNLIIIKKS